MVSPTIGYATQRGQSSLTAVQRLFTMFPRGLPGVGLLCLRFSAAIALLINAHAHRLGTAGWTQGAAILLSIAMFAGSLTPVAAILAVLLHGLMWYRAGIGSADVAVIVPLDAFALILLGPGAYSVDGLLFGHRQVVLPPP